MALSRLRWALGGAIALLSLVVAVRALGAYVEHRLWLGSASVLLLAAIAIGGIYSLGRARLRVERALAELGASTIGGGGWLAARRAQLLRVRDSGAVLDLDAIATATAAEERGHAYLGRYLVAVTVLVGLVGTFAGLMETLREVAPLLRDDRLSTAQALAAPLAGLDVTFGASVVGILVTLALALVQGDLVLAEEQALARLEERTAHELVPALWPPAARADERLVAEVAALRREVQASLAAAGEATATRVAAATREEIGSLVAATRASLERVGDAVAQTMRAAEASARASAEAAAEVMRTTGQTAAASLRQSIETAADALRASTKEHAQALQTTTQTHADALRASTKEHAGALQQTTQTAADAFRTSTKEHVQSLQSATQATNDALQSATQATNHVLQSATQATNDVLQSATQATSEALRAATAATSEALRGTVAAADATLRGSADAAASAVAAASTAAVEAARESSQSVGGVLRESTQVAAQSLADAAVGLRDSSASLSASLATLAPELAALAREVALLASRADDNGADPAIADELVRVGEGVERLEQLLVRERDRRERA